jgi:glyoxylase-like metal-dependent hydrolase (beta-lactamase superfamily II)
MANARESELHYPFGDAIPALGETLEIVPGVRWVRMALPFVLDHVNLWLLRDRHEGVEGWTIVDCGITNDTTKRAWEQIFERDLDGLPVLRVLCTHMHPDHIGLAHWLTQRWSIEGRECPLWISATDWNAARVASTGSTVGVGGPAAAEFFASHGLADPESLAKVRERSNYYVSMVPEVPARFRRLLDGQPVTIADDPWNCIVGYGHAPEHIGLHSPAANLLIAGDMVLPRISTNVSVIDIEPESNPLALYLESIEKLRALPADTLVLPSHGKPFTGLHSRIDQLVDHHAERYADVLTACATAPRHAAELLPVLFKRTLDLHQTTFAMGESIAHLHALWFVGKLRRLVGADGVIRFATA